MNNQILIENVNIEGTQTDDSGFYEVNISGDKIEYEFQEEYQEAKAYSEVYIPTTTKKYNIVIVKPENDCENEYREINNVLTKANRNLANIAAKKQIGYLDKDLLSIYQLHNQAKKAAQLAGIIK